MITDVVPLSIVLYCYRKKIEFIGKMTQMTQEEIMTNTKTVVQGLEALKNEHNSILNGLTSSLELAVSAVEKAQQAVQQQSVNSSGVSSGGVGDASVVEEKTGLVQKSLEMIELGLGEAQVKGSTYFVMVASNLLDKRWRIADKGWSSGLGGVGHGAKLSFNIYISLQCHQLLSSTVMYLATNWLLRDIQGMSGK